ncbi:MAG TPA: bacterial transcriptional activator domain-containing protein, partial [Thermoanaerobaculia bacterium]|nr:bacterial transcriptional activator domain-containing protein [Thermoanaerobaculia bacterium]
DADPTDEDAARNLMKALAERGDTAGATRVYRRLVDTLRRTLDVEPERETTALAERLKNVGRASARHPTGGAG